MQTPTAAHRVLHRIAGNWEGYETVQSAPWDPAGGPAQGRIEARVVLGGFFVVSDYAEERDGAPVYAGHGVYGWDAARERYTMHWFDAAGDALPAPALGTYANDTLVFEGRDGHARYVYRFHGSTRYDFCIEVRDAAGGWGAVMEARYHRCGAGRPV